jgi:prepilin-type processing-associated H-X9-DG protein
MSTFGTTLWEGALHATAFSVLGIILYLAMRRWSPAAGSLASASTLFVMAVVSLLAFSPWPRWTADVRPGRSIPPKEAAPAGGEVAPREATSPAPTPGSPRADGFDWSTYFHAWAAPLWVERVEPSPAVSSSRWSWRDGLAVAFPAAVLLGLGRLVTGLWAMRRLRRSSRPVSQAEIVDALEVLRAEMGCVRPVALRVSAELATPATIGARRPLILLPEDWTTWDEAERRAVLAHELAHVCRGDFLSGLIAQLSVALQFYHPLAHWLSARLRLEQELAADAWTARLSGGSQSYLTTLARMALRRDDQRLGWPARAFLPSRHTFVRRIDMLRHSKRVRHVPVSSSWRFGTLGTLAALGVIVAGFRGPARSTLAEVYPFSTQEAAAKDGHTPSPAIDLKYLPAGARAFIAAKPAELISRREFRSLQKLLASDPGPGPFKMFPPGETEQVILFWEEVPGNRQQNPQVPPPSGLVVKMNKARDWKTSLPGAPFEEVQHAGQTYLNGIHGGGPGWAAYIPDGRTLVAGREDLIRELIEDLKAPADAHAWDDVWKRLGQGQLNLVVDVRWLRRWLDSTLGHGPGGEARLEMIAPLVERTRVVGLGFSLDRELRLDALATVADEQDLKPVTETAQALLTLGKNALKGIQREGGRPTEGFGEVQMWMLGLLGDLLEKAQMESAGTTVRLRSTIPYDGAEAARVVDAVAREGRTTQHRYQSVNNLKQIGLAFHNYVAQKGELPRPVMYGGKTGKVPYSWRVALLPYLESQDLYEAYNFDEPWDGPNNRKLIDRMPAYYAYPAPGGVSRSNTSYFVLEGPGTMLGKGEKVTFMDVTDGTSNTLLVVEAKRDVPWTKPEDLPYDPNRPLPEFGGFVPDGFNVLFADGSVRFIRKTVLPLTLRALITRAGSEVISLDSL